MKKTIKEKLKQFALLYFRTVLLLLAFFLLYPPSLYSYSKFIPCIIVGTLIWVEYIIMLLKEKRVDYLLPIMCVYASILVISSAVNNNETSSAIWREGLLCLSLVMLFAVGMHFDSSYFLFVFYFYCIMIIVWNLFSFQQPFWTYAFGRAAKNATSSSLMGHSNIQIVFLLPALFVGYILLRKKYFSGVLGITIYIIVYALSIFCSFYFSAYGNLFVLILWGLFLLLGNWVPFEKVFRPFVAFASILLTFVASQLYDPDRSTFLSSIFAKLEREGTFNARVSLWKEARVFIEQHPFIGIGVPTQYKGTIFKVAYHAHNIFLQVLLKTGAIGFGVVLLGLAKICQAISYISDRKLKWATILFFFCILFNMQFDVYASQYLYGMAGLLYFVSVSNALPEKKEKLFWKFRLIGC